MFESWPHLGRVVNDIETGEDTFERLGAERGLHIFREESESDNEIAVPKRLGK